MKHVYVFSGLGADERVFKYLKFYDYSPVFIKWIQPASNETIEDYSSKLVSQIFSENPILLGVSFGGIIAIEVAKQIKAKNIIIIASAKTRKELPFYYRFAGALRLHKILPYHLFKRSSFLANWFFGAHTVKDRQMLKAILHDTDPIFLRWAINQVVNWKNESVPANVHHIHGTSDKILPYKFVKANISITRGGHFLTVNRAAEINEILKALVC